MSSTYLSYRLFGEAGRSFAFDQRGTGYGRGEGCGILVLKTLEQALKDNDPIRAVITGSGINQDGRTPGITMPNGSAQGNQVFQMGKTRLTRFRITHTIRLQEWRHGSCRYRVR